MRGNGQSTIRVGDEKYGVEAEINYDDILDELGMKKEDSNECGQSNAEDRRKYWNGVDVEDMLSTTIFVDWDRRRSIHFDKRVMDVVRGSGCNVGLGESMCDSECSERFIVALYERCINEGGFRKGRGICKLRRAGRYKFNYEVDMKILGEEGMLEKLRKVRKEEETELEKWNGSMDVTLNGSVEENGNDDDVEDCQVATVDIGDEDLRNQSGREADEHEAVDESGERADRNDENATRIAVKHVVKRRRRRRSRVQMHQFRLHDYVRRSHADNSRLPSVEERLKESLRVCHIFIGQLQEVWVEVPHLRAVHLKEKGRRMLAVSSARMKFNETSGCWKEVCSIAFMIECEHRDIVTLNMMQSRMFEGCGRRMWSKEVLSCSCSIERENGVISQSKCVHTNVMHGCDELIESVRKTLGTGFSSNSTEDEEESLFGSWICVDDRTVTVGDEQEGEILCTQLDQVDGRKLTTRGATIAKRRSYWNVLDVQDHNFVCCVRSALGSGISVTKIRCFQCREGSRRRCRHESSCANALTNGTDLMMNENGEICDLTGSTGRDDTTGRAEPGNSEDEYADGETDPNSDDRNADVDDESGSQDSDECTNAERRACLSQPKHYWASRNLRPLYMCAAERKQTAQLTDMIERWERRLGGFAFLDPIGWPCEGIVRGSDGNEMHCEYNREDGVIILERKVTLFTLNQDILSIVLKDWICPVCTYENRYSGHAHGIFPATRQRAFSVDLMYFWMHECTGHAMSFRSLFELTSNLQNTKSYRRRFDRRRIDLLAPEHKADRRLANESLRRFCKLIDLKDDSKCTTRLFSCTKCEISLDETDCMQLGLRPNIIEQHYAIKRFKSLVLDGKVIGSLRDFPVQSDDVHPLLGAKGLKCKVMNNRLTRNCVKSLTDAVRKHVRAIEYGRGGSVLQNISENNGIVYFRLGSLLDMKAVTKSNFAKVLQIARWMCDNESCLCTGNAFVTALGHSNCESERKQISRRNGCKAASSALKQLFAVGGSGVDGEVVGRNREEAQEQGSTEASMRNALRDGDNDEHDTGDDTAGGSEDEDSASDNSSSTGEREGGSGRQSEPAHDIVNEWIQLRIDDAMLCPEVLDAALENIHFALGEPVTLGFFPWFTRSDNSPTTDTLPTTERGEAMSENSSFGPEWDQWSIRYMKELGVESVEQGELFERDPRRRKKAIDMLSSETEKLHRDTSAVLAEFSRCTHVPNSSCTFPCQPCFKKLESAGKKLSQQNATSALLVNEVVRVGRRAPKLSRTATNILHDVIDEKLRCLQKFKLQAAKKMDTSVSRYWRKYGHLGNKEISGSSAEGYKSMYVFPGRKMHRPPIRTVGKDKAQCTKNYFSSRTNLTSFLSLQCPCEHPKIIGFTLLKQVESLAMAISTIMGYLNIPPRTLWYDNACNLYDSALLRTPFLLRSCYFIVDRFHYQGHTCSGHYNPDRYKSLTKDRSTAAEVLNSILEQSTGFIRYLKGENVKPYLKIMFAIHNFKSILKDKLNRKELPSLDLHKQYSTMFPCTCAFCKVLAEGTEWREATTGSISFQPIE